MLVYVVWTYKHFYQCSRWQLTPKRQKYKCVWILLLDLFLFCGIVLCSRERDNMTTLENFYFGNINPSSSRAVFVGSGQVWPLPYSCGGSSSPPKAGLFGDPVRAGIPRRSYRRWQGCLMNFDPYSQPNSKGEDWADWKLPAFADCSLWEGRLHRGIQVRREDDNRNIRRYTAAGLRRLVSPAVRVIILRWSDNRKKARVPDTDDLWERFTPESGSKITTPDKEKAVRIYWV